MADTNPKNPKEQPLRFENFRPQPYPVIFTNNASISVSTLDLRIDFGDIASVDNGVARVEQRVQVVMSHGHAKAFVQALTKTVEDYEKAIEKSKC